MNHSSTRPRITLELGSPIFTYAPADIIHSQIEQFLAFVAKAAGPFTDQREYAMQAMDRIAGCEFEPTRGIHYAIAVADYCLFDEMRPDQFSKTHLKADYAWTDLAAIYGRFFRYSSWFPEAVVEAVKTRSDAALVHLAIGYPQHVLNVNDETGALGMLTPELAYWANGSRIRPPLGVCRQQLFASLLRCGINPFAGCQMPHTRPCPRSGPRPRYLRKYRKLAALSAHAAPGDLARFQSRATQHWEALLGESELCPNKRVLLFNSGTAANESVIAAMAEVSCGAQFTHPFWYFENRASIVRLFQTRSASDPGQACIVFLNLEPATLHSYLIDQAVAQPHNVIRDFAAKARTQAPTRHWLVVDVTLDPLFSVTDVLSTTLPDNMCVIKTVSATKHQRGARNYFFGVAAILNERRDDGALRLLIAQKRALLGGMLSDWHHLHFPRPGRTWLHEKRQRVAALNRSLLAVIPAESKWQLLPCGYSAFLIPPMDMQHALNDHLGHLRRQTTGPVFGRIRRRIKRKLSAALVGDHHDARFPDIETGNSFGLSVSRILVEDAATDTNEGASGYSVRISPGYDTSQDSLQAYVGEMFERFRQAMHDLLLQSPHNPQLYELSIVMSKHT